MKNIRYILLVLLLGLGLGCSKTDFLDKKPISNLLVPKTLNDFQGLLDNTNVMMSSGGLAQLSADEYMVSDAAFAGTSSIIQRNGYIWSRNLYGGEGDVRDWSELYRQVFYANAVLDGLQTAQDGNTTQGRYLKGWALFARAFAFYDLIRNFCKPYQSSTSNNDLGIPLRLTSGIDYIEPRSSLQASFDRVLSDLLEAEQLLPTARPNVNFNRPSKLAVYALLARIYLDMRRYDRAEDYANKALGIYSVLIDYNMISKTSATPFTPTNDELIYNRVQVASYAEFTGALTAASAKVLPELIALYGPNDLRLTLYFTRNADNTYSKKRGYIGSGSYAFTGLATDELYLILAECLARRSETSSSMMMLNRLVSKRWDPNASLPARPYTDVHANTPEEALREVLLERRKELVWRGLRWHDLKRLNMEGAGLALTRTVAGVTYTLPANDPRWVFPIPDNEVQLSGLEQNDR